MRPFIYAVLMQFFDSYESSSGGSKDLAKDKSEINAERQLTLGNYSVYKLKEAFALLISFVSQIKLSI